MTDQLVTFETAKLAKEKGFGEVSSAVYNYKGRLDEMYADEKLVKGRDIYLAPTQTLLQRWLREKCNIAVFVSSKTKSGGENLYIPHGRTIPDTIKNGIIYDVISYEPRSEYERALEEALQQALNLI